MTVNDPLISVPILTQSHPNRRVSSLYSILFDPYLTRPDLTQPNINLPYLLTSLWRPFVLFLTGPRFLQALGFGKRNSFPPEVSTSKGLGYSDRFRLAKSLIPIDDRVNSAIGLD
jgi:hypothetical protein